MRDDLQRDSEASRGTETTLFETRQHSRPHESGAFVLSINLRSATSELQLQKSCWGRSPGLRLCAAIRALPPAPGPLRSDRSPLCAEGFGRTALLKLLPLRRFRALCSATSQVRCRRKAGASANPRSAHPPSPLPFAPAIASSICAKVVRVDRAGWVCSATQTKTEREGKGRARPLARPGAPFPSSRLRTSRMTWQVDWRPLRAS